MASPSPRDQAIEVMARAIYGSEWDDASTTSQEITRMDARRALDALAAARRQEPCPTCGGTRRVPADVSEMSGQALNDGGYACSEFVKPCPDCTDDTVDAGNLAVAWLTDVGVLELWPNDNVGQWPVYREVAPSPAIGQQFVDALRSDHCLQHDDPADCPGGGPCF